MPHERPVSSIEEACQQSRTRYFWLINYLADYQDWDFLWEPPPWQAHQRHAWCSQWQKDSGTYLIPKNGFTDTNYHNDKKIHMTVDMSLWENIDSVEEFDFSWHPDYSDPAFNYEFGTQWQKTGGPRYPMSSATQTKYVSQSSSKIRARAAAAYMIDHGNETAVADSNTVTSRGVTVKKIVRYFDNYLDTLTRIARNANADNVEYVWICSSVCDYSNFDFTWHPETWQNHMLHVFPSDTEKFGDTFFMHVPTFVTKIGEFELLEWYDLNFVDTVSVPRKPMPVVRHQYDSQADAVRELDWSGPLALFTNTNYVEGNLVTVPLWRAETKTIVPLSMGATSVIVPKPARGSVKTQLYDYSYIDKTRRLLSDDPLDIVFISNGESIAEEHFARLAVEANKKNKLHRVSNINGRAAAYHAAARASTTPWFFAVFAKLEIDLDFDWTWQPDRMQAAKHYIFHARNPVNGLVYGHQAMIAYNQKLVLNNPGIGLDFTLDSPHEVVPILSGVAYYNTTPWSAWRTAFREVIKLQASLPDVENEYRLNQWLNFDNTDSHVVYEDWSRWGAQDAVEYYNEVGGDFSALKKSYEWSWLSSYALLKRGLAPDQ